MCIRDRSSSFPKADIPDGFTKSSEKYNDKKYTCIKGEVKKITAFYLYNDEMCIRDRFPASQIRSVLCKGNTRQIW